MKLLALALLAAAVTAVGASASTKTATCSAGTKTVGGVSVRTFCGPAHATVHAGGKTLQFSGGNCSISGGMLAVNIGSITLGTGKPKYTYFGLDVNPPKAGSHAGQVVSWQTPGKRASLIPGTVVVAAGLKSGTFSGPVFGGGGTATGSFTC